MKAEVETLIIGGGQAGLSVSYHLIQRGREHLILEQAAGPANAWRNDRWDSFTLNTPNWMNRLPGADYKGDDPDGFMRREEVIRYFEKYLTDNAHPIQYNTRALSVEPGEHGFRVETNQGRWGAKNAVIATGGYQGPKIPEFSHQIDKDILQTGSGKYRNPSSLPPGAVLVAGSGQSGCQIAEELNQAGRKVYLSVGSAGRVPRRYRGQDIFVWLTRSGFMDRTAAQLPSSRARFAGNPQISGNDGGRDINLHRFHRDGVILLGRVHDAEDGELLIAPDLKENLAKADQIEKEIIKFIDEYILKNGLEVEEETLQELKDGYTAPETVRLNLKTEGISTVIWACGYTFDFSWIKAPLVDSFGYPTTRGGDTAVPGLYFAGLPWIPSRKTGLLLGVGEQAGYVAERIAVNGYN